MTGEAIILAGGLGTRLKEVVPDTPKSMALINGRPFLEYQLDYLDRWGLRRVILSVGYGKEKIMDHFGGQYKSLQIAYSVEEEPLGTGGAIISALQHVEGFSVFIFNGDTYFDVNLQRLDDFRRIKEADICLAMRFEIDPARFGMLEFDNNNRIIRFYEKPDGIEEGYINGGVYIIRKDFLLRFGLPEKFSFEIDFLQKYYQTEEIYGMRCFSYFRDIGIPEDYQKAIDEFKRLIFY
ncbi:MAG: NTP transferase domain-containing protein [Bacteroidales bacterium]|nr:NTP transferase domain-containing protein [Bacteroidales bacterium]